VNKLGKIIKILFIFIDITFLLTMAFLKKVQKDFVSESLIEIIKDRYRNSNDCHLLSSAHVNIMILGKTGVGKSTFFNLLKDPTTKAIEQSVVSQTKDVVFQPFTLNFGGFNLTINLIDTPGVREYKLDESRTDQSITNAIVNCVEKEITKLHLLVICVSVTERFTEDDKIALEVLHKNFCLNGKLPMMIVVTKAEGQDEVWYRKRIFEIKTHPFFAKITNLQIDTKFNEQLEKYRKTGEISYISEELLNLISEPEMSLETPHLDEVSICFTGYVDTTNKKYTTEQEITGLYDFVYEMRKALVTKILDMYKFNPTGLFMSSLPYYQMMESDANKTISEFVQMLEVINRVFSTNKTLQNYPQKLPYIETKNSVLKYIAFYDISVMASYFALISDLLSNLHKEGCKEMWVYEGFDPRTFENEGSLSLNFLERLKRLPAVVFKIFKK
jgi:GTP-binding protein EngB required for normal cell division